MSGVQSPTATLSVDIELSEKDVDFLHKIVVRAQDEPQGTDRDSLLTAYQAIFQDRELDPVQDDKFFWLLLEILKPGVDGDTLLERFDCVMQRRGIEMVFDDDLSMQDSAQSHINFPADQEQRVLSRRESEASYQSSKDITDLRVNTHSADPSHEPLHDIIEHPPAHIVHLEHIAEVHIKKTLITLALGAWRDETAEVKRLRDTRAMEQYADRIYQRRLTYKVLTHWQSLQQQIVLCHDAADEFLLRHKNASALTKLRDTARVNRIQAMEDVRLRGMALYKLTLASREIGFRRKLDHKLKHQCLSAMLISLRSTLAQRQELEARANSIQVQRGWREATSVFRMIYHSSQRISEQYDFSSQQHETNLKRKAGSVWGHKAHQLHDAELQAENLRRKYLMRKYFSKMKEVYQARHDRRIELSRWVWNKWRNWVRTSKRMKYTASHASFRQAYKRKRTRLCLRDMLNKARVIANMQQTAIDHSDAKALARTKDQAHEFIRSWYEIAHVRKRQAEAAADHARKRALEAGWEALTEKTMQVRHLELRGETFLGLHVQTVSRRCLRTMTRRAFEVSCRQQDANTFRNRHDRQMLRSRWDEWRRKVAENRGEGPLILPPATPAQRRADQLSRLASTTPLFGPRTSFAARLRGDIRPIEGIDEDSEENG